MPNLKLEFGTHYFHLTWDAPYSLVGLAVWYNVTINSQDFAIAILVNSTNHSIPASQFISCHEYQISVASINEAGIGNMSIITKVIPASKLKKCYCSICAYCFNTELIATESATVTDIFSSFNKRTVGVSISVPVSAYYIIIVSQSCVCRSIYHV